MEAPSSISELLSGSERQDYFRFHLRTSNYLPTIKQGSRRSQIKPHDPRFARAKTFSCQVTDKYSLKTFNTIFLSHPWQTALGW